MQEVTPGARIALDAVYRNSDDELVDPTTPLVDILDPSSAAVVTDAVPVRSALGLYDYPGGGYLVPADAALGLWTARWTGTVDGNLIEAVDEFEVVAAIEPGPLATFTELQTLMPGVTLDEAQASFLLAIASATIRSETRQTLSFVAADELELRGTFGREFWLPEWPVVRVASIALNGESMPATGYRCSRDGRVTFDRWTWSTVVNAPSIATSGSWGGDERFLTVVYDHGYDPVPADIKGICIDLARRGIVAPDAGIIRQESLGSYNVSYNAEASSVLSSAEMRKLRRYCRKNATVLVRS